MRTPLMLACAGALLLARPAAAEQAKPATPAAPPAQTAPAAPAKFVAPIRGEAELGYTKPVTKRVKEEIITTMKVKNLSATGAIAGLKVDEFWYDKAGNPVTGAPPFRHRKPLMPGEVVDVVLRVPRVPGMDRNQFKFEHANGTIKPTRVPKL